MAIMASASTPSIFGAPRFGVRHTQTRAAPRRVPTVGGVVSGPGFGAILSGRVRAWHGFGTKTGETHKTANVASLVPGAVRSALSAFRAGSSRQTRPRAAPRGTFNAPGGKYGDDGKARTTTWITHARRFNGKVSTMDAFFGQDDEDRTDAMTATFNTSASGDPVDKNLALPRVPVTLSNDKAVWYWVCLGVAVATFLVPIGYARWGLLTIAPLKWWQVAASTAAGTLLASPYLLALTNPAVSYRLSFPALARVAFGVKGALVVTSARAVLGAALTTLTTLAGGFATKELWSAISDAFFFDAALPTWVSFAAYVLFWCIQLFFVGIKSQAKKIRALGRLAAVAGAAYVAWSVNAGDATTVWTITARAFSGVSAASGGGLTGFAAAAAPVLDPELWKHALMVCGTWITLGAMMPDYAQRMQSPKSVALGVTVALPVFAAVAALIACSMFQAKSVARYPLLILACLVTNAGVSLVGPVDAVKRGFNLKSSRAAAAIVTAIAAIAAYAVLPWQTVAAYAAWSLGAGSLFVAPAAGVVIADYWVLRARVVDRDALQTSARGGAYHYDDGVNWRAVTAFFLGMAPETYAFAQNVFAEIAYAGAGAVTARSVLAGFQTSLGSYVTNSEWSAVLSVATAFVAYVLLTVLSTPASLKLARANAAALTADERADATSARIAAASVRFEPDANADADAPVVERFVDDPRSVTSRNDEFRTLFGSYDENSEDVSRSVTKEETEEEIVITTVTRKKRRKGGNRFVDFGLKSARQIHAPDADDVDLNAARRFYLDTAERIGQALGPARAAKPAKQAVVDQWRLEERVMFESHVTKTGRQSMAEVRYEIMRVKNLIADAELDSATVDDELAEAWLFFEDEAVEDSGAFEMRLLSQRAALVAGPEPELAHEVFALIDTRRARAADAKRAVPPALALMEAAAAAARDAQTAYRSAADELRSEDESLSQLRNWVLIMDTWRAPPVMDVPMLPMSESEARTRAEEDARRVEHELLLRFDAEEETGVRAEEDARRALAEADIRRLADNEDRERASEDRRRRAADEDIDRLRALVIETSNAIETTKVTVTRRASQRETEERSTCEREESRREASLREIERVTTDLAKAVQAEQQRREDFDARCATAAAEEEAKVVAETRRLEVWEVETETIETEERELRVGEDTDRDALLDALEAARDALDATMNDVETRRRDATDALRDAMDRETQKRYEEDSRRADAEREIPAAAIEERQRMLADEDSRRAAENARRADAADAAGARVRQEQARRRA